MKHFLEKSLIQKYSLPYLLIFLSLQACSEESKKRESIYGEESSAGKYLDINGIKMYYEIYGKGEPLILIHGNGGSISEMGNQIQYFCDYFQVIAADSREHGKSSGNTERLTYEDMTTDWAVLLDSLNINSANIIGWSDGGIIGLLLAINFPEKVKKLAICGANLQPDSSAVNKEILDWLYDMIKTINENLNKNDTTQNWNLLSKYYDLLANHPHIPIENLHKIKSPTLVMAGDRDIIREEHTLRIFNNIPNSQLCIFPASNHNVPVEDADLFNYVVNRFFNEQLFKEED